MLKPTVLKFMKLSPSSSSMSSSWHCGCVAATSPFLQLQLQRRAFRSSGLNSNKLLISAEAQHKKDCRTLGVSEDCQDEATVRDAYIKLAKRFHPDSGTPDASASKFQGIDAAYRNFLKHFADFRHNRHKIEGEYGLYYKQKRKENAPPPEEECESPDIKHTAPQHRQYLSYDGVGSGTPRQREKQYQKWRAMKAADNVLEHKIEQLSKSGAQDARELALAKDQKAAKKIKTGIGIERLVEDMIQDAMARGDFDNLSGKGKPLSSRDAYNPYIDFTTHKLNQVLIDNGFAPEWILLEKEVKAEVVRLRTQLREIRHIFGDVLTETERQEWEKYLSCLKPDADKLNKNILKYNLTVPSLHKQIMGFLLEKEAHKAESNFDPELHKICSTSSSLQEKVSKMRRSKDGVVAAATDGSASETSRASKESFIDSILSIFK